LKRVKIASGYGNLLSTIHEPIDIVLIITSKSYRDNMPFIVVFDSK